MKHAPRPNTFRDAWAGDLTAARCGTEVRVAGLGPPPPRPRRAHLHRPARPLGPRAARRAPAGLRRRLRRGRGPALRARRLRRGRDRQARPRERQPEPRHRRDRDPRALAAAPGRQRDAALRRRRGRARRRDAAPAAPHARPAPREHARGDGAAPRGRGHHAPRPQRARLPGDRDADPHALDARGRARLPRAQPPAAGLVVRAAAVAPALQAAADDERLRALLPDRPLLPRRGPARRPPARVHPARRRDVLRRRGRRHRDDGGRHGRGLRGRGLRRAAPPPWPRMGFDEAMLRFGSDRPDTRFDLEIVDVSAGAARQRVQGLRVGPRRRRRGARAQRRRARDVALGARGAQRGRPAPRRQGGGVGLRRGRRDALADRQVPGRGSRGRGGRASCGASEGDLLLFVADQPRVAAEALGALRLELGRRFGLIPEDGHDVLWVVDFPMFEPTDDGWGAVHHPFTAPTRRLRRPRARCARARYDLDRSTAGSSAAARSASTRPRSRSRSSRSSA